MEKPFTFLAETEECKWFPFLSCTFQVEKINVAKIY